MCRLLIGKMGEATSGLQLGVCLGVILLVFTGGSTASNSPKEKLLGFVKRPDTLESSSFLLTNPTLVKQDEEEEAERKKNDFNLPNFEKKSNRDENESEKTTMIATTVMTINGTNRNIVDELEAVTDPVTITIESSTTSSFLDNELEVFDRTKKQDNTLRIDEKENVSSYLEETRTRDPTTTSIPTTRDSTMTSIPTTRDPTTSIPTTRDPTTSIPTTRDPTTNIPTTRDPTTSIPTTRETMTTSISTTREPMTTSISTTREPMTTNISTTRDPTTTSTSTTSVPVTTSVPTTTILSSYSSSERTEKRLEPSQDSTNVTTTIRDTSIYENTIDRKDSEKRPIVTEPSVVLENSIQQSGSVYRFNNITSESTISISSTGTTESTKASIETLTSAIPLSYATSGRDDFREKPDFTGNGITENSSPITSTQTTLLSTPSDTSIPAPKTEASTSINEIVTSNDYYTTLGASDSDFSTEITIESSDITSTSLEPTSSLSSTSSSSTIDNEYELVGSTESSTNVFATTSSSSIENTLNTSDLTSTSNDSNISDSFPSSRNLSETISWPRMMTDRTVPGTLSPSTSISTSSTVNSVTTIVTNTTDSSTESTIVATTVESATESLEPTPMVQVVVHIPYVTIIRNNKVQIGKKATDIIPTATTVATDSTTTTVTATTTTTTTTEGPPPDEVTSLVKITLEGTWQDVCTRLEDFRQWLATFLSNGLGKNVTAKQIHFHQNPCNGPPNDETLFSIFVYVVDENGKFDPAATKNLPNLYKSTTLDSPIPIRSLLLVQETDSSNAIAVVVVSAVAFICLLLLAGLLFVMRKRQTRFNYGERCRPVSLDAYSLDSVSAYNSVRRKGVARSSKRSYGNPAFEDSSAIPSHPLSFAGLSSFSNDVEAINEEFSGIPQVSAKMDELPPGAEVKNRYANVIPLPESRVPLRKLNDDPLSEYINANYVRGPKNATKYYIACQAPLDTTVTDFWRMIWEQQCKVVIMLTDLVENGVEKCTEYIPPSEVTDCHRLYGDFQVTLKKRETKEKYAISTLHLKNLENNTFREVYHIWYLWPTTGVQSDGAGLIAVLLEARALQRGGPGPIVVHCSPGTGRTGTLIALDLGIRQYEITRTVDVPRVVYTIRRDRAGAVQTKEQYAFIYKALNLYATKLAGGMLEST